ncbi:MAG: type II secretion system protein [Patescibacteria group bacterium]
MIKNKRGERAPSHAKGFTLIEMLVVIAVVGILAATVLTALGPARNKAKDARVISAIGQARAIMETLYTNGSYPVSDTLATDSRFTGTATEITNNGGTSFTAKSDGPNYVIYALLNDGNYYCGDTSGAKEFSATAPSLYICE